jgi:cupin fold WbuC family metalloprotein
MKIVLSHKNMLDERTYMKVIDEALLKKLCAQSLLAPRKRINYNLHEPHDLYQRFINVINTGSYMHPHRHKPGDDETFIIIQGICFAVVFDNNGIVTDWCMLNRFKGAYCVDIPAGTWHTLIVATNGTAIIEAKAGPYDPTTAKEFAPWAPKEGSAESNLYLADLTEKMKKAADDVLMKE